MFIYFLLTAGDLVQLEILGHVLKQNAKLVYLAHARRSS